MGFLRSPFKKQGIYTKILVPVVVMTVAIGAVTVFIASRIITGSIETRADENLWNNERLFSAMLQEQEEKVAFYSQFMADMVKLSQQVSETPSGRSMLIYLMDFLKREKIEIHLYRNEQQLGDARRFLIRKGLMGIRTSALLELHRNGKPYLTMAGVSPVERKEGISEVVMATFDIDDIFLSNIKSNAGADLLFFHQDKHIFSTLSDPTCLDEIKGMLTPQLQASLKGKKSKYLAHLKCDGNPQKISFHPFNYNFKSQGIYALSVPMNDLLMARQRLTTEVVLIIVFVLALGVAIFSSLIVRRIVQPLQELSGATKKVAEGDLTQELNIRPGDELGELGDNFNQMIAQLNVARNAMEAHHVRQMERAERLAAMGQMASGIAHEFNNILAIILANAQLMLRTTEQDSGVLKRINAIERAAKDGAQTVRRMQEFAKARKDEDFVAVNVNEIIDEVVEATKPRWREKTQREGASVELVVELGKVEKVSGNPAELREVITNLIFNALDAMPKGGKITVQSGMDGDNVFFSVKDTGEGMNEEVQNRIFDPFFTTKGAGNSGLGMSVSYGIISRHEGEILLESKVGQGTVFTIKLPLRSGEEVDVPQETVVEVEETANVLVIDDEQGILDALSDMLTAMGHRVSTANNGLEGLEKFMKTGHDVVFTDLGMPGVSGWEVAKSIKEARPNTPVIMLTGWQLGLSEDKMKAQNVDLVITKPFEINKLHKVMAEALELKSRM